jgi:hypothetical protein
MFYLSEDRVQALMKERNLDYLQARNVLRGMEMARRYADDKQRLRLNEAYAAYRKMVEAERG